MLPYALLDRTIYFTAHTVECTLNKSLSFRCTPRHITSTIMAMETISNSIGHFQNQKLIFSLISINPARSNLKSQPHCRIRHALYLLIFFRHKMPFLSFFNFCPNTITFVFLSPQQREIAATTHFHFTLRNSIVTIILSSSLAYPHLHFFYTDTHHTRSLQPSTQTQGSTASG